MSEGFWDWAVRVYADKAVAGLCLELQDDHDHCVPLLLWAMWAGAQGMTVSADMAEEAADVARSYHEHVITPLRSLRRKLKAAISDMEDGARLALRKEVKIVELNSEAALMRALEALMPKAAPNLAPNPALGEAEGRMSANLIAVARIWNPVVPRPRLLALNAATAHALGF